jgi:thymidylate synthase (FAD)
MTTYIRTTPDPISVLDEGYVRLVDVLGDDVSVVNAARVSYDKETTTFEERDAKLLKFCSPNL